MPSALSVVSSTYLNLFFVDSSRLMNQFLLLVVRVEHPVPRMKSNLLGLDQLLEKGFVLKMEDNSLKVFDSNKRLLLKAYLL